MKSKINKKIIVGVALLMVLILAFVVVALTDSDDELQNVRVGESSRNVYENYGGETVKVDDEVKKQVDSMVSDKRADSIENKSTNIEHIPVGAEYISVGEGTNIKDFFKDEFIACVTSDYDENGFHCKTGFNREGFNKDKLDVNGFGEDGCNLEGYNILGDKCANFVEPVVEDCIDGLDADGNLCGEFATQYDENGCDENLLNIDGESCIVEDEVIEEVEEVFDPICLTEEECIENKRWRVSLTEEERVWYNNRMSNKTNKINELVASRGVPSFRIKDKEAFKTYVEPTVETSPENDAIGGNNDNSKPQVVNNEIQIPTGSMINAKLESDINSDYGGTVRATIQGGKLHGSSLYGTFSVPFIANVHLPRDKVGIRFDRLVHNRETFSIEAIGLDAESLNDFVGGKVNNHYVLRWGGLVGSTFLKGLGEAASYGTDEAIEGSDNVIKNPIKGTSNQLKVAFGEMGSELSQIARDQFTRPPTVTIDKNSSRGASFPVVFMQEVVDPKLPMLFSRTEQQDINRRMMMNPNLYK